MVDVDREAELRQYIEALYFGYRSFTSVPDRILSEHGLARAHHRILYFVTRQPGISMGDLLAVLHVTKQAVHRPVKDLEARGLMTVAPDTRDKRIRRVTATPKGVRLEARLTGEQMHLLEDVLDGFTSEAESDWRDIMLRLAEMDE